VNGTSLAGQPRRTDHVAMGLLDRLRRADSRVFTYLRQPGESAEEYLRRVAAWSGPGIGGLAAVDVHLALREFFAADGAAR
jgi:hypothetical protein